MRILFVAPYVPSPIRVRPYHLIKQLSKRHDVSLLVSVPHGEAEGLEDVGRFCEQVIGVPIRRDQAIRSCLQAALRGESLQAAYCRSGELRGRYSDLLGHGGFDVIHLEHLRAAHLLLETRSAVPVLYDAVDSISLLLQRTLRHSHSIKQRAIAAIELDRTRRFERQILRRAERVVVTSRDDADALRRLAGRASVDVLPNGVDLEFFAPSEEPHEPATIVLSGKMSYHANVTAALHFVRDIVPLVRVRHADVRIRIVGSSPPPAILALQRDPHIEVTGHVVDIRPSIRSATVAVCPVTVKVGIQNKILEAMALGIPVVSTQAGTIGLDVNPGIDILVGIDAAEVAGHLCAILESPTLRRRIGQAGRRFVETHHRWEVVTSRLEELYAAFAPRTLRKVKQP